MRAAVIFFSALLLVVLAAFLAPVFKADPGYVLVRFQGWSVETTVLVLLLALLLLFVFIKLAFWLWRWPLRTANKIRENTARKRLEKGLLALLEGDYKSAEKALRKSSGSGESTLALLGAARAAEGQSRTEARESYLHAAERQGKTSLLVGLSRAEILMANEQWQEASEILETLLKDHPRHQQARTFLYHCYRNIGNWEGAGKLAPGLLKAGLVSAAEDADTRQKMYLQRISGTRQVDALKRVWKQLPAAARQDTELIAAHARQLTRVGSPGDAEILLRKALNKTWSAPLIHQYALLDGGDPLSRLKQTEKWLRSQPEDPDLHLAIGRLCLRNKIWGKAREHLQTSLGYRPDQDTFTTLAALCHRLGEMEQASDYYRQALELCTKEEGSR